MEINKDDYLELKRLYKKALEEDKNEFTFKGEILIVGYAKYLLEYLKNKFESSKSKKLKSNGTDENQKGDRV